MIIEITHDTSVSHSGLDLHKLVAGTRLRVPEEISVGNAWTLRHAGKARMVEGGEPPSGVATGDPAPRQDPPPPPRPAQQASPTGALAVGRPTPTAKSQPTPAAGDAKSSQLAAARAARKAAGGLSGKQNKSLTKDKS